MAANVIGKFIPSECNVRCWCHVYNALSVKYGCNIISLEKAIFPCLPRTIGMEFEFIRAARSSICIKLSEHCSSTLLFFITVSSSMKTLSQIHHFRQLQYFIASCVEKRSRTYHYLHSILMTIPKSNSPFTLLLRHP